MKDLTIELRQDGVKHLYEQIYEHIKNEIRKGKLLRGEKLPSTRSLAEFLTVSRNTVELAYEQLLSEGYIESKPYKGYFVCEVEDIFALDRENDRRPDALLRDMKGSEESDALLRAMKGSEESDALLRAMKGSEKSDALLRAMKGSEKSDALLRAMKGSRQSDVWSQDMNLRSREEVQSGSFLFDFSPHAIDMTAFPFATWKKITKNILVDANSEMFASGSPKGDRKLREIISRYLYSSRGVNCMPEQIIVGAGNDYLLMLLEKILGRHVKIAMENPTYKRAYRIFDSFAYRISPVSLDAGGMSVKGLRESGADVAYVMPSHQYPTGIVMPIGRRMELLRWAEEKEERYLIEDDYDSEFRFKGKPVPSLQASDWAGKVIYIGTFSKSIAPAIRISYMVLPLPLLKVYEERCSFYSSTVSRIDQRILGEFIEKGYFERHLNKMRKLYREKHDLLLNEVKNMEEIFTVSGEGAGLHILLKDKRKRTERELISSAADAKVKVYGLSDAFVLENMAGRRDHTVILGYAALDKEHICEGMQILKKVWK